MQTIKIEGLERTKNDIVTKHVQPVLLSKNFEEVSGSFNVQEFIKYKSFISYQKSLPTNLWLGLLDN